MIWKIAVGVPTMFFAAIAGLWVADREPPTTVFAVQPLTAEVQPGGQMRALYTVRRFRSCAVHVDRLLFDSAGERYVLEDLDFAAAPGQLGDASYTVGINIPRRFSEGPARYQAHTIYLQSVPQVVTNCGVWIACFIRCEGAAGSCRSSSD